MPYVAAASLKDADATCYGCLMPPNHFLHVLINESLWRAICERRDATGESTAEIVESALRDQLDLEGDAAFQASTIGAVLDGVYHGDITVGELRERGDFGLGTFDEFNFRSLARAGSSISPSSALR